MPPQRVHAPLREILDPPLRRSLSDNTMMQFVYFYFGSYTFIFGAHPLCHSQVHASVRMLC